MLKEYMPLFASPDKRQSLIKNGIVEFCFSDLTKHFGPDNYFYIALREVVFHEIHLSLPNSFEGVMVARSEAMNVKVTRIRRPMHFEKFVFLIKAEGEAINVNEFMSCRELEAIAYLENSSDFFDFKDEWELEND